MSAPAECLRAVLGDRAHSPLAICRCAASAGQGRHRHGVSGAGIWPGRVAVGVALRKLRKSQQHPVPLRAAAAGCLRLRAHANAMSWITFVDACTGRPHASCSLGSDRNVVIRDQGQRRLVHHPCRPAPLGVAGRAIRSRWHPDHGDARECLVQRQRKAAKLVSHVKECRAPGLPRDLGGKSATPRSPPGIASTKSEAARDRSTGRPAPCRAGGAGRSRGPSLASALHRRGSLRGLKSRQSGQVPGRCRMCVAAKLESRTGWRQADVGPLPHPGGRMHRRAIYGRPPRSSSSASVPLMKPRPPPARRKTL